MGIERILVVVAHPDDESFICGGTIAKYAKQGAEVTVVSATKGELGRRVGQSPYLSREALRGVRERELREACQAIGVQRLEFLDILDKTVEFEDELRLKDRIAGLIQEIKPDVLLTFHEVLGGHPDHLAIGKAATRAYQEAVDRGQGEAKHLYFITFGEEIKSFSIPSEQITAVDIRDSLQEKLLTYRAHRTQTDIVEWVWQSDERAIQSIHPTEYFIRGGGEDVLGAL
ncbi:PIG-L family deacetylase [Paenibacillus sp. SI8]|uniref:PIG-L family deacetylase n=1 Tax=unclassified Paenibacillus TaxID=185978 RepID=UPI0034654599